MQCPTWPPRTAATSKDANEQGDDVSSVGLIICCERVDLVSYMLAIGGQCARTVQFVSVVVVLLVVLL